MFLDMADKMEKCAAGLIESAEELSEAAVTLYNDFYDQNAKRQLLDAGKDIMKLMVELLQLNDLYEVAILLKHIQTTETLFKSRNDPAFSFNDLSLLTRHISKLLDQRATRVYESKIKTMLDEASVGLGRCLIPFIEVSENLMISPTQNLKERKEAIVSEFSYQLDKAKKAVRLSAKSPFDLSMLDKDFDFDDFEEEIVSLNGINDGLASLAKAVEAGDEEDAESALRSVTKDILAQLDNAEEQALNCKDPYLKDRLLEAVKNLRNKFSSIMDAIENGTKSALLERNPALLNSLLEDLKSLNSQILSGPAKEQMLQRAANIQLLQSNLIKALKDGDVQESFAISRDIAEEVNTAADLGECVAENVKDDSYRKERLKTDVSILRDLPPELEDLIGKILNDPRAFPDLSDLLNRMRKALDDLINASMLTTPQEIMDVAVQIDKALADILLGFAEYENGNFSDLIPQVISIINMAKPQIEMVKGYAESLDPEVKKTIDIDLDALKAALANLVNASKAANASDGKDLDDILDKLKETVDNVRFANSKIVDSLIEPEEESKVLHGRTIASVEGIKEAVAKKDLKSVGFSLAELKDTSQKQQYLAKLLTYSTDDEDLKKRLLELSQQFEKDFVGEFLPLIKSAIKDPKGIAPLENELNHLDSSASQLVDLTLEASKLDELSKQKMIEEERRRKEEAEKLAKQRQLEEEALAGKDEIYKAGHKITQAVNLSPLDDDGSAVSLLVKAAEKIGLAMKELSELSKADSKKDVIERARSIANFVTEIQKLAARVADECSDKKLVQELKDAATVVKNFSIQLKIVCAVKGSSSENDDTANRSLINCAQGLCKNVVDCVNVARIAKLKKKLRE